MTLQLRIICVVPAETSPRLHYVINSTTHVLSNDFVFSHTGKTFLGRMCRGFALATCDPPIEL